MNTESRTGGSPLTTLLLVLFVGLKLTGYIAWSWWWVLSPVLIPLGIALLLLLAAGIVLAVSVARSGK